MAAAAGRAALALAAPDVDAGRGQALLEHGPLLGRHLAPCPLRHLDVEEVGGHDQRLVVAVQVELKDVLVVRRRIESPAQGLQTFGQPVALVVEVGQSLSP